MIDIYINPDNPNQAIVYTGMNFFTFIPLLIGLFFLALALLIYKGRNKMVEEEKVNV